MPTISKKLVRARKAHQCAECLGTIDPGEQYVRLYGNADDPDPKYVIRVHKACYYVKNQTVRPEEAVCPAR